MIFCLSVRLCALSRLNQFKVYVCVSVISGCMRIIAQMRSISILIVLKLESDTLEMIHERIVSRKISQFWRDSPNFSVVKMSHLRRQSTVNFVPSEHPIAQPVSYWRKLVSGR